MRQTSGVTERVVWRKQTALRMLIPILFLAASAFPPLGFAQVIVFDPPSRWLDPEKSNPGPDELFLDVSYTKDWQDRTFLFNGRLDNGTVFVIGLVRWHFPVLLSWGLLVAVTDQNGRVFKYEETLPLARSEIAKSGFRFKFGGTVFEEKGDGYEVKIALKGFSCDLSIRNILPPWEPGDGWAYLTPQKDAFIHYTSPSPWASVSGSMEVFGQTVDASGQCSWASSLSVMPLSKPSSPQFILSAFSSADVPETERAYVGMSEVYPNEAYGSFSISMLLVAKGGQWILTSKDFFLAATDWQTYEDPPYQYPSRYSISVKQEAASFEGDFRADRVYSITDVMQKVPRFLRSSASAIFKRAVIFRMVGTLSGTITTASGEALPVNLQAIAQYAVVK